MQVVETKARCDSSSRESIARIDVSDAVRAMNSTRNSQIVRYACAAALALLTAPRIASHAGELMGLKSGLPMPRFVSLKPDRVNVRGGPTRDHEVMFVYTRAGLPVEITAESDNWRRIRDWEGSEGWVYHSLLSGRGTAGVMPKDKKELVPLYDRGDSSATVIARLQAGGRAAAPNWPRRLWP